MRPVHGHWRVEHCADLGQRQERTWLDLRSDEMLCAPATDQESY
jgi:hypothetical protein